MIALFKRCIHCGTEYTYYASGVCDEYNNEQYCPNCYKAMMMALKQIPLKYEPRYKEVDGYLKDTITYDVLVKIKNKFIEEINQSEFKSYAVKAVVRAVVIGKDGKYHYTDEDIYEEEYQYKSKQFKVSWNKNSPEIKKIEVLYEYDVIENKFTNKIWMLETNEDKFIPLTTSPKLPIENNSKFTTCIVDKKIACDFLTNELMKRRYGEKNE